MRKELDTAKKVQKGLIRDLNKVRKKIRNEATKNNEMQQETEELHNEILALKQKDQDDKTSFEDKMRDLKKKLSDTDTSSQRLGRSMMQDNASTMAQGAQTSEEFSNPADLLKERLVKWVKNNKEKKHLMDKYIRNVKVIEDAFEQIREAEGIPTVQEIVSTFVKSEEQNYHMTNYLNTLNSEIDTIQEQNRKIQAEIEKHEKIQKLSEDEKQAQIELLKTDIQVTKLQIEQRDSEIEKRMNNLKQIQKHVEKMVAAFQSSSLPLSVAQHMQYDEDTILNDKNATQYMAEVEEYIGLLITNLAYKRQQPNAAISAIPLEQLGVKEFSKGKYNLDTSNDDRFSKDEGDVEEKEDLAYNERELIQKFQEKQLKAGLSSIREMSYQ